MPPGWGALFNGLPSITVPGDAGQYLCQNATHCRHYGTMKPVHHNVHGEDRHRRRLTILQDLRAPLGIQVGDIYFLNIEESVMRLAKAENPLTSSPNMHQRSTAPVVLGSMTPRPPRMASRQMTSIRLEGPLTWESECHQRMPRQGAE